MIPKSILLVLISFTLIGCSNISSINSKKSYTHELQSSYKTPKEIERERALERYRQMRFKDRFTRRYIPRPRPKAKPISKPQPKKPIITVDPAEQRIEIKQNLSFHCMKYRKRYRNEDKCKSHTSNIYNECREKFVLGEKGLLRCVKSQLR